MKKIFNLHGGSIRFAHNIDKKPGQVTAQEAVAAQNAVDNELKAGDEIKDDYIKEDKYTVLEFVDCTETSNGYIVIEHISKRYGTKVVYKLGVKLKGSNITNSESTKRKESKDLANVSAFCNKIAALKNRITDIAEDLRSYTCDANNLFVDNDYLGELKKKEKETAASLKKAEEELAVAQEVFKAAKEEFFKDPNDDEKLDACASASKERKQKAESVNALKQQHQKYIQDLKTFDGSETVVTSIMELAAELDTLATKIENRLPCAKDK